MKETFEQYLKTHINEAEEPANPAPAPETSPMKGTVDEYGLYKFPKIEVESKPIGKRDVLKISMSGDNYIAGTISPVGIRLSNPNRGTSYFPLDSSNPTKTLEAFKNNIVEAFDNLIAQVKELEDEKDKVLRARWEKMQEEDK